MAFSAQYNELDSYSETTISRKTNCRGFLVGGSIILAIAVTAVIIIALAVPLGVINEKYRSSSAGSMATSPTTTTNSYTTTTNSYTTTMCLTPECVKLAASVLAAIDQTADPCTDFYKFSCGNWIRNTIIPTSEFILVPYLKYVQGYIASYNLSSSRNPCMDLDCTQVENRNLVL